MYLSFSILLLALPAQATGTVIDQVGWFVDSYRSFVTLTAVICRQVQVSVSQSWPQWSMTMYRVTPVSVHY